MNVSRRPSLGAALFAAPLLLYLAGSRAVFGAGLAGDATTPPTAAQQFYTRALGDWVGTTVSRLDGAQPVTGYFHLLITRVNENTIREDYTFYRLQPKTAGTRGAGGLETSGTETDLSTMESDGAIHRTVQGSGTILIDFKPKNQSFEASGAGHFTDPDHLEVEVKGKIAVDGMPLGLGKHGKLQKATATWSLEEGKLIGQTQFEASFHVLFFAKRYRIEIQLRGERGTNFQTIAGRVPVP
jgi:hypothetical protein